MTLVVLIAALVLFVVMVLIARELFGARREGEKPDSSDDNNPLDMTRLALPRLALIAGEIESTVKLGATIFWGDAEAGIFEPTGQTDLVLPHAAGQSDT